MNYPMAHKIRKPFAYTPSHETDIKVRFERIRQQQKPVVVVPANVAQFKKVAK